MIRLITTRRRGRLLDAQVRHERRDRIRVADLESRQREIDALIRRNGQLEAEASTLRQQVAARQPFALEHATLVRQLRAAEDRARALDERLTVRQFADEAADRAGYDATYPVVTS